VEYDYADCYNKTYKSGMEKNINKHITQPPEYIGHWIRVLKMLKKIIKKT
jgi:hypothetical protein